MKRLKHNLPSKYIAKSEDGSVWVVDDYKQAFFMALISNASLRIVRVPESEVVTEIHRVGYTVRGRFWNPPMGPFYWALLPEE